MRAITLVVPLMVSCLVLAGVRAQEQDDGTRAAASEFPADLLDRGTPRRSMRGFLSATGDRDYARAAQFLDLRNLPRGLDEADGPRLAENLDIILQRHVWIDIDAMSNAREGWPGDGLPPYRDRFGALMTEGGEVTLLMQRVPGEGDTEIWKISNATVAILPELYDELGYPRFVEDTRRSFPDVSLFGIELFKWFYAILLAVLVYVVGWIAAVAGIKLLTREVTQSVLRVRQFLTGPALAFAVIVSMNWVAQELGVGFAAQQGIGRYRILLTAATLWLMLAGVSLMRDLYVEVLKKKGRAGSIVLVRPMATAAKILISIMVVLMWLDNAGFQITTLLAGLGVGGIAFALVLQKPLEDVFGALSLYSQQPLRVGDFCRVGDISGTVEEIALRSTRIRTLENTLVAIPNSKVAGAEIDNYSKREKIWYHPILRLKYETTPEQLRQVLSGIQALLNRHEKVISDGATVRFTGFGEYSVEVGVRAYLATTTYSEFLAIGEELNLEIMDIVSAAGTTFATPPDWKMPALPA